MDIPLSEAMQLRRAQLPGPESDPRIEMSPEERAVVDALIALRRSQKVIQVWLNACVEHESLHQQLVPIAKALIEGREEALQFSINALETAYAGPPIVGEETRDWANRTADAVLAIYPESSNMQGGAISGLVYLPPIPEPYLPAYQDE